MKSSLIPQWVIGAGYHSNYLGNIWRRCRGWSNFWNNQIYPTSKRIKKKACAEWQKDYRRHSLDFGKIIYDEWLGPSRLASCQYRNGRFEHSLAIEPAGENVGLARTHLVIGYPTEWELYRKAVAESTEICNTLNKIINSFEEKLISAIDTKTKEYNLQRRDLGYSPKKCDDVHHYIDRNIFSAVFELIQDKIENKPLLAMKIERVVFNIGDVVCPYFSLSLLNGLGSGTEVEVTELKSRIENLIHDPSMRSLIEQYNVEINKLHNNQMKKSYRDAIEQIWTGIHDNGELLKAEGVCENIQEYKPRP